MDCVFFGTPEFARRVLEFLPPRHRVIIAVTRPDRPAGRGRRTSSPAVKEFAQAAGIPCLQPADLEDASFLSSLAGSGARVGVVVSYGGYLPRALLGVLPRGFINLHPSLLPRYRGAAPVNWAIIRGEEVTGVSVIRVTEKMDAGPILRQERLPIDPGESAGELLMRLAAPGAAALAAALDDIEGGRAREVPQDDSLATTAPRLRKEDGRIDWTRPAPEIADLVRGVNPWPGAFTWKGGAMLKVWKSRPLAGAKGQPGEIIVADPRRALVIAAGEGSLGILEVQLEGGERLPFDAFLRGARWREGELLSAPSGG